MSWQPLTWTSGKPKENFCLSSESRKRDSPRIPFLQKYWKNRKKLFLPKECLSAEIPSFYRIETTQFEYHRIQKEQISAESGCFCQKRLFLQKYQNGKCSFFRNWKTFCRDFLPKFHRNALSVAHHCGQTETFGKVCTLQYCCCRMEGKVTSMRGKVHFALELALAGSRWDCLSSGCPRGATENGTAGTLWPETLHSRASRIIWHPWPLGMLLGCILKVSTVFLTGLWPLHLLLVSAQILA